MRTYQNLNKKEKETFDAYIKTRTIFTIRFCTFFTISALFLALGILMISIDSLYTFLFGIYSIAISIVFMVVAYYAYIEQTKLSFLIFGIEKSTEDIFGITEYDLRSLKRKWIKVK